MENKYSFLKDPRALAEIKKHKWIESQKAGREIGFASAAVDWVKKYGEEWKKIHVKEYKDYSAFFERRRFRRFKLDCYVELIKNNILLPAKALNLSFFGLLCQTKDFLSIGNEISAHLLYGKDKKIGLVCNGTIDRAFPIDTKSYELFLRFDNNSQQRIENLANSQKIIF